MAHSIPLKIAEIHNMKAYQEAFADRVYVEQNQLQSRSIEGSVISDSTQVTNQLNAFISGQVVDYNNQIHPLKAETICLHSDTPEAIKLAKVIYHHVKSKQIVISAFT